MMTGHDHEINNCHFFEHTFVVLPIQSKMPVVAAPLAHRELNQDSPPLQIVTTFAAKVNDCLESEGSSLK